MGVVEEKLAAGLLTGDFFEGLTEATDLCARFSEIARTITEYHEQGLSQSEIDAAVMRDLNASAAELAEARARWCTGEEESQDGA